MTKVISSISLPEELHKEIKKQAELESRSMNNLISLVLKNHFLPTNIEEPEQPTEAEE